MILRGARQVGKTTAVEIFSKEFDQYIYMNLEKHEDANIFSQNLSIEELIQAIYLFRNISISGGRTLLFIDEIQNSPQAVSQIRYFYESAKELHVIAAGSLLEVVIGDQSLAFPVGRVQYLFMYPLTFKEFLAATGEEQALKYYHSLPLPDFAYAKLLKLFHRYTLIGGMPEIVKTYIKKPDIVGLREIYQGLLAEHIVGQELLAADMKTPRKSFSG